MSSSVQASPAKVTLTWPQDTNGVPSSYTVYRKAPGSTSWGAGTTLSGSTTSYTDTSVAAGQTYEYRVVKAAASYTGYGYIQTGVAAPVMDNRGKVVLVVDNSIAAALSSELARLQQDLAGDGWVVVRRDVGRTDSAASVKAVIKSVYDSDPANVKSVFLFGHVPVPYSGQLNPDGHPDHIGAWPADAYYGDMDGSWTDSSVNYIQTVNTDPADAARISNVPGDGKFDQTTIPSTVELEVGRVDLSNMPGRTTWGGPATFPSETELLRKYLNKDHNFRHRISNSPRRAILADYFGIRGGEAFAASGFRSFAPLVGASNIRNLNVEFNDQKGVWVPQSSQNDNLLAYGSGAGSYSSIGGLGNTGLYNDGTTLEMVNGNVRGVFNLLFGSWLGDWDHEDNILRAPLATDFGLVSAWSGRPHWFIHPMGAGETVGYVARLAMNNNGLYQTQINSAANRIHIALMGDPTLRLHPVAPASNVNGSASGSTVALTWSASPDSNIVGYHVYRGSLAGGFSRVTGAPVTSTSFTDSNGSGSAAYMVRAIKLEDTTSGTYHNASQGAFWNVGGTSSGTTTTPPPPTTTTDTTAPTIAISAPAAGATVSGTSVSVSASVSDNVGVTGVQFKIDGSNLGAELGTAPFSTTLNTTTLANGTHSISAVARDAAGNQASATAVSINVSNTITAGTSGGSSSGTSGSTTTTTSPVTTSGTVAWFDDALPAGAGAMTNGDTWNWVSSGAFSGTMAHRSDAKAGYHDHSFGWATPFAIGTGDTLVQYVYLDPANPPSEIMLSWAGDNWDHRAYWGANNIPYGVNGTASQYYMGPLPAAGQWIRLEVPARLVGLEGQSISGMAFALYDGAATWDLSGKAASTTTTSTGSTSSTVTLVASDATAMIGSTTDTALLTFSRSGGTDTAVTVNFTLGGTATKWNDYRRIPDGDMPVSIVIPAGATSASMTIMASSSAAEGSTATVTLASDAGYTVGSPSSATLTFSSSGTTTTVVTSPTTTTTTTTTSPTTTTPTTTTPTTTTPTTTTPTTSTSTTTTTTPTTTTTDTTLSAVTVVATDPTAMIGSTTDTALLTFARTGSTAADLIVNYVLGGTATKWNDYRRIPEGDMPIAITIPAGAASATMTIMASSSATDGGTATFTLANDAAYTVGSPASAVITLSTSGTTVATTSTTTTTTSPTTTTTTTSPTTTTTSPTTTTTSPTTTTTTSPTTTTSTTTTTTTSDVVWFDDQLPLGAIGATKGGDSWLWVPSNPTPYSGTVSHQSINRNNLHEHSFNWATETFAVASGDKLFVYVYIDPANKPTTLMLSWCANNWEHRAYWGANKINYGTDGTTSRRYMGDLPAAGQWVRLEVPASAVALEGATLTGMGFHLQGGRVWWDKTGKLTTTTTTTPTTTTTDPTTTTTNPPTTTTDPTTTTGTSVTVAATDAIATVGSSTDTALVTFTRTGSTSSALTVNYALGGTAEKWTDYRRLPEGDMPVSVVIPAGASSTNMTIGAFGVKNGSTAASAIFTLSADAAYTVGSANVAALTIATSSWDGTPVTNTTTTTTTTTTNPSTTPTDPTVTTPTTPITPSAATAENAALRIPQVGDYQLRVLTPTELELQRITAGSTEWNFVDANGNFNAPAISQFAVTVNGQAVNVSSVGFRRRVGYAPLLVHDLRVDNCLYLTIGSPVPEGAAVEVKNPSGSLWPSTMQFKVTADPGRYSPAIHVNQEGYVPGFPKKAMVGYYLGNKGELDVSAAGGFRLVNAASGETVFTGTLTLRKDVGYTTSPMPYQKVLQADFSSFRTPGEYQLVVPGVGASLPFIIDEGVAMAFQRTYALGLYHQRCGCDNAMPFTRFVHGQCHILPAEVPSGPGYDGTWTVIASETANAKNNPRHTAPAIVSESTMLYPFVNKGRIDVSGGHHDAGDYSKYTINVANLIHQLMFNADSIPGADALDNLGLPNSGDGISDILQEAKHEADFLAKMQDADGGFYFLVYPKDRRYEFDTLPDSGIQQVVWPKTTAVTAASVGALAQMASSPKFKALYPAEAAAYLQKARLGWQFLMNAIARFGKDGSYQKITHYGDEFMHDDELAWAACELFLATGEAQYHQKLLEWFPNPADPNTMRWTWIRLFESYGNTIRSYAFAARSGRQPASALNGTYLAACENQIKLSGDDMLRWSTESAYGTAFPDNTKRIVNAGWYFSLDQASDMAVAYQLNPKPEYIEAIVSNMNYEAGSNPVNVSFLAGVGLKRQRELVNQYGLNDRRLLPPIGLPAGNIAGGYSWLSVYGSELNNMSFPADTQSGSGYALQDRWADVWNVTAELVTVQQARAQMATSFLATQTGAKSTAWKPAAPVTILASAATVPVGQPVSFTIDTTGLNLAGARVTWEARDQQPDFGSTYTIKPKNSGAQWVEVEITWPDGRRLFGAASFNAQ